jgi:hypothetical protein
LDVSFAVPDIGPGMPAVTLYMQSVFMHSNGELYLDSSRTLTVLDPAY